MKSYFFTFGFGTPYRDCYVEILAENEDEARVAMVEAHGTKWSFQYEADKFDHDYYPIRLALIQKNFQGDWVCLSR